MVSGFADFIAQMVMLVPAYLVAITVHEYMHAWTATFLGDPTPRREGRFTLNPFAHIDWLGLFALIFIRIGWARPVPFNPSYFRRRMLGVLATAFAGPLANFIAAFVCICCVHLFEHITLPWALLLAIRQILLAIALVNISLGVFNFIPVPPLDGGHLTDELLRDKAPQVMEFLHNYGIIIVLLLMALEPVRALFTIAVYAISGLMHYIVM